MGEGGLAIHPWRHWLVRWRGKNRETGTIPIPPSARSFFNMGMASPSSPSSSLVRFVLTYLFLYYTTLFLLFWFLFSIFLLFLLFLFGFYLVFNNSLPCLSWLTFLCLLFLLYVASRRFVHTVTSSGCHHTGKFPRTWFLVGRCCSSECLCQTDVFCLVLPFILCLCQSFLTCLFLN